jgi:hypothetical protein
MSVGLVGVIVGIAVIITVLMFLGGAAEGNRDKAAH